MLSFSHSILCLSGALQDTGGVGGLLAVVRDDGGFAPTYDANGNVSEYIQLSAVQTDNYPSVPIAGGIVAHYEYSPFGEITAQSGGMADGFMFRFSTKYYETETAILHYGRRPYRPSLGCWLSRDPVGEKGGWNLYGFVKNNPINKLDYLGLADIEHFMKLLQWLQECEQKYPEEELGWGKAIERVMKEMFPKSKDKWDKMSDPLLAALESLKKIPGAQDDLNKLYPFGDVLWGLDNPDLSKIGSNLAVLIAVVKSAQLVENVKNGNPLEALADAIDLASEAAPPGVKEALDLYAKAVKAASEGIKKISGTLENADIDVLTGCPCEQAGGAYEKGVIRDILNLVR